MIGNWLANKLGLQQDAVEQAVRQAEANREANRNVASSPSLSAKTFTRHCSKKHLLRRKSIQLFRRCLHRCCLPLSSCADTLNNLQFPRKQWEREREGLLLLFCSCLQLLCWHYMKMHVLFAPISNAREQRTLRQATSWLYSLVLSPSFCQGKGSQLTCVRVRVRVRVLDGATFEPFVLANGKVLFQFCCTQMKNKYDSKRSW